MFKSNLNLLFMNEINLNDENIIELVNAYVYENMIIYINEYPCDISYINFENIFYNNLRELTIIFLEHYFDTIIDNDIFDDTFENIWNSTTKVFYKNIIPKRSYKNTFIRTMVNKKKIKEKIELLRNSPQPAQRTEEWYKYRYNLITASNAYKCFENDASFNSIIYEKCKPYENKNFNVFSTLNTSLHWGQKYEPISVLLYEKKYSTVIEDFGCLPHTKYKFLGASPDGINVDENNERYGRMLEIKNIVNRDIVDDPKKEYWVQMQLQMEVCNLNECDFLETRFKEYENYDEFISDGTFTHTHDNKEKGIIILFIKDEKPVYEYSPIGINKEEYCIWEKNTMKFYENDNFISIKYWRLDEFSCKLVLRNRKWFNDNVDKIKYTWNVIENERIHGYEHRAPQKKVKKIEETVQGCLINIDGSINEVLENIETIEKCIDDTNILPEEKKEETGIINDKLKLNCFKVHTESFDDSIPNTF